MVNTLELCGIETYSPEIQTFLREIEKSFLQVLNNCVPADQQEKEATQLRDTIEGIGNYLEIQPIVVLASHVAYENIGWDEQGEVIPGISMTVVRRIPTRNLTWLKSIVENYSKEFFEKFAIFCDDWHIWDLHTDEMSGWHLLATIAVALTLIALFISTIGLASVYIGADASVAKWETQYESLTYQLENNLYDNDNDIGKKELMDEIHEWNGNLAYCKKIQRNFWVGIYYPSVYDNFEFIPLP